MFGLNWVSNSCNISIGAPTGARVPFVRVPSYPGEVTRLESYQGKTYTRVESYQGGKLPWGHLPGCQILFLHFFHSSFLLSEISMLNEKRKSESL